MQETIASALAQLGRLDPQAARFAEQALSTLITGQNLDALNQRAVQEFCWYVLPARFTCPAEERPAVARALGKLFTLLDMPRYAEICTSPTTDEVLAAYAKSGESGDAAYERSMRLSGIDPPDLPELTWGTVVGGAEIEAYHAASAALELGLALGDIRPGTPGWRTAQEQCTRAFLTHPDSQGRSRLGRIREERVREWLASPSHPHRQQLLPLLGQIIAGVEPSQEADRALAPIQRLLDHAGEGIGLTQIGYMSPTVVRELCVEFDWHTVPAPPRSETDVTQLIALHKLLRTIRAVRRSGRRLILTRRGRKFHENPDSLWRAAAQGVLCTDGFEQAATETLLGLLLLRSPRAAGSHRRPAAGDIAEEARLILAESGWEQGTAGDGPEDDQVRSVLITVMWLLETLGCVVSDDLLGEGCSRRLTKVGRAFALTAIHLSATAPRASI